MSRLIDADELLKAIANSGLIWETNECLDVIETLAVKKIIDDAPTVDTTFKEVVAYEYGKNDRPKGKWIVGNVDGKRTWICSECGAVPSDWVNKSHYATTKVNRFCRYCGADMRGDV